MKLSRSVSLFLIVWLVYLGSFLVVYLTGVNQTIIQSEDAYASTFLPFALLREHTFYLDNYFDEMTSIYGTPRTARGTPFYLVLLDGHYLSAFPVITPILALPVYLLPVILGLPATLLNAGLLAKLAAMIITALSVPVVYLVLRGYLKEKISFNLALLYGLATNAWALASQTLWQHGASLLLISLALWAYQRRRYPWLGLVLSLAVLNRPTSALAALGFGYLLLREAQPKFNEWRQLILAGLLPLMLFWLYNHHYFGSIWNQGYGQQLGHSWTAPFPESFLGMWLSPSKGILVYSPFLAFSLLGGCLALRRKEIKGLKSLTFFRVWFLVVLGYTLVVSKWYSWFGGYAFGYRMATDLLPLLMLLLVPAVKLGLIKKYRPLFRLAVVWSVGIQLMGMAFFDGIWHRLYDGGAANLSWLWSIKNSEIAFNLRRILAKLTGQPPLHFENLPNLK